MAEWITRLRRTIGVAGSSPGDSKQFVGAFTGGLNVLADNRTAATFAVP